MPSPLKSIASYLSHFTEAIASITGADIEVIDSDRIRVTGTGRYASCTGENIEYFGQIYNYSLTHHETVFVDNPKKNRLCRKCPQISVCKEKLTFCTPIVSTGRVIGIIGLVCFTEEVRERLIANRDVYDYFFRQIANGIALVAEREETSDNLRHSMDMLLKVTNTNTSCVVVLDAERRISFVNDAARQELGLPPGGSAPAVQIIDLGDRSSGMGEFELVFGDGSARNRKISRIVLGELVALSHDDPLYRQALVFESKRRIAEMISRPNRDDGLAGIVGGARVMSDLKESIRKIAATSSTVLITGESGTGKEMFARAIHAASRRKDKPFIALNCGAIPDALLESELFGYVGGAFTGANPGGRMGKFELADQGVLFLDEIGSMPLYLQVKLLRVLQERSFSRLGSNKNVSVDIRVIAASNEKIPDLIAQRAFREDLYYRLNVIPISIPPLRERKEDIPVLAGHFLNRYCERFGKPGMIMSEPVLRALGEYDWPGNVRELENHIEYLVNMNTGGILDERALPEKIRGGKNEAKIGAPGRQEETTPENTKEIVPLEELEMRAIDQALGVFGESSEGKRLAAVALGISTATLYRKLKRRGG